MFKKASACVESISQILCTVIYLIKNSLSYFKAKSLKAQKQRIIMLQKYLDKSNKGLIDSVTRECVKTRKRSI